MLLRLPDPILVVFDYHNDRSKPSLEQPSSEGFLFMTRPHLDGTSFSESDLTGA
jgi:hypothetical protein